MRATFEVRGKIANSKSEERREGEVEVCERREVVDVGRSNWSGAVPFAGDKQVNVSPTVAARREG